MKAIRSQADDKQETLSETSGLDCTGSTDYARQEFKEDADTNSLLKRYGVGVPQRAIQFGGETDFDIDLQQALEAVNQARTAYRALPADLRKKYPSWQTLLNSLETGALKFDFTKKTDVPPDPKKEGEPAKS